MAAGFEASFLYDGQGFCHGHVLAGAVYFIDQHGGLAVQFAAGEVHVFFHMGIAVDEAGEEFAFCQFMHEGPPGRK